MTKLNVIWLVNIFEYFLIEFWIFFNRKQRAVIDQSDWIGDKLIGC